MTTTILNGDVRQMLAAMAPQSVHCVITSPPYLGLRDYKVDGQIGLEASIDAYLRVIVTVFREVHRVLRDDGTLWLNMGDSYGNSAGSGFDTNQDGGERKRLAKAHKLNTGLAPKNQLLMPARVALALQSDGWIVRKDVIWAKLNPEPESAKDRPTSSHEHVFLLTKRPARYYYDAEAVRDPMLQSNIDRLTLPGTMEKADAKNATSRRGKVNDRNMRDVIVLPTASYPGAHFATFPPQLAAIAIYAGTSHRGCCPHCGAPWRRVVIKGEPDMAHRLASGSDKRGTYHGTSTKGHKAAGVQDASDIKRRVLAGMRLKTYEWAKCCGCPDADPVPCTVLDPFGGSGTTAMVADRLQRHGILIELNPEYCEMSRERIGKDAGMFADVRDLVQRREVEHADG